MRATVRPISIFLLCVTASLLGCDSIRLLETEYVCAGEEQSTGYFTQVNPVGTFSKRYPIDIDFHIRGKRVLVKTYLANKMKDDGDRVDFELVAGTNWLRGEFRRSDLRLMFATQQSLALGDESISTLLSGQYTCKAVQSFLPISGLLRVS
ncbi:hypothetical protein [Rhodoferax mekongensis]|uniref:hypothetical protein n=1 Tax=Rhodoferax mekongensis TaxID=3068341 RepID=UPI0028BEFF35|nr:hypothetical protein [Rhodoferax sp. TBRC 17199]MDT7517058.1 hypothetical protein [Rhodoferax sp. TBRC 17199]